MCDTNSLILDFESLYKTKTDITETEVVEYLDKIVDSLNLDQIYVVTNSIDKNNYLYSYVSSKGAFAKTMHLNLFVVPNEESIKLVELFKNGTTIIDDSISAHTKALAIGNLAYGFVEDNHVAAFVSFSFKEEHVWSDFEKEIIQKLAKSLKPLIDQIRLQDKKALLNILTNSKEGDFYYYPNLKLIIVPEDTMNKFTIPNFIYQNAPESFIEEFVSRADQDKIKAFVNLGLNETKSITFNGKNQKDKLFKLTITPSRIYDLDKVEEVLCSIEVQDSKPTKQDFNSKYDRFREIISRNNLVEFYVDLKSEEVVCFKVDKLLEFVFNQDLKYSEIVDYASNNIVDSSNKIYFNKMMNIETLKYNLNNERGYLTFSCNYNIKGKRYSLETTIIPCNRSIYNYTKEVLVSVRNITNVESLNFDKVTGLYSLSYFTERVNEVLQDKKSNISIAYFDFKEFRNLNYVKGIEATNDTILKFSNILKSVFNDTIAARVSNDHFISYDNTNSILDKVNQVLDETKHINQDYLLDLKVGIYHCESKDKVEEAIDKARVAREEAKSSTESIKVYDDLITERIVKEAYIIDHLDEAISKKWINVYYQPVVDSIDEQIVGMEALSRWIDPVYGFLSPAEFIPLLEERNLIYKLDLFVLEEVCQKLREQIDLGYNVCPISFNLSRNDFLSTAPFEFTMQMCDKYKIDHSLLNIEITETVTMLDQNLIKETIKKYHDKGHEVWMDDFGSGYSSLNVLKDFDFDEIKIDMAFLRNFDERSMLIVKYVTEMAKSLKIRTLCEGVETKEHVDFLKEIGCQRLQGYYYSKPLPYDEVLSNLSKRDIFIK